MASNRERWQSGHGTLLLGALLSGGGWLGLACTEVDSDDSDEDGWTEQAGDCDDEDPEIHPGAPEVWYDGVDQDCDGASDFDQDGDGQETWLLARGTDCWDDPTTTPEGFETLNDFYPALEAEDVHPGAPERWYDGVDADCAGDNDFDADADGQDTDEHPSDGIGTTGEDCHDHDDTVALGAEELCDGLDNDCDGVLSIEETDGDGDGVVECAVDPRGWDGLGSPAHNDCDDTDVTVHPAATELCDGQDNDCDGRVPSDEADDDGDGYVACTLDSGGWDDGAVSGGDDCDDTDRTVYEGAHERCDGQDNDCDGSVPAAEEDDDDDGYVECDLDVGGWDGDGSKAGGDCSDEDPTTHRGATEDDCTDPHDYNCDGSVQYADADSDGFAACRDCNDDDDTVYSGADELCDGQLNDCRPSWPGRLPASETDFDADGYVGCTRDPGGWDGTGAPGFEDCDNTDGTVHPAASELCDGLDNDCDGSLPADEDDGDGDGYVPCTEDSGGWDGAPITGDEDCDDADGSTFPGAGETCGDGVVNDCEDTLGEAAGACAAVSGEISLGSADAKLSGEVSSDYAGFSVSSAGDVNDDGYDDLLVGAYREDSGTGAGAAYLVFGPVSGEVSLGSADAKLTGEARKDYAGYSVSTAGDVDDDGYDDLFVGAPTEDSGGTDAGAAYLVLGPASGEVSLASADAKLAGEAVGDHAGESVSGAGDINDDGYDDLLVGACAEDHSSSKAGAAYLVLGPVSGAVSLGSADAKLTGEGSGDCAGVSVSSAGDVDDDGYGDLLVGARYEDRGGWRAGAAYLILGPVSGEVSLADADAKLIGEESEDYAGTSVSSAGDVNDDGHDDLLVGASGADIGSDCGDTTDFRARHAAMAASICEAGAAYLVYGPVSGTVSLGSTGARLTGEGESDSAGHSVSAAGDVNDDGYGDLLVGAYAADGDDSKAGAAYLVLGGGGDL